MGCILICFLNVPEKGITSKFYAKRYFGCWVKYKLPFAGFRANRRLVLYKTSIPSVWYSNELCHFRFGFKCYHILFKERLQNATDITYWISWKQTIHYNDVIMSVIASQISSPTIVYSSVYSTPLWHWCGLHWHGNHIIKRHNFSNTLRDVDMYSYMVYKQCW